MEIKKQYEKDNYIITEYTNGAIVKELKLVNENVEPVFEPLSENELRLLKIESDLEYIKILQEINSGL